jgi:hypothetical protein
MYSPAALPGRQRAAPAKKRKQSMIAGSSSASARAERLRLRLDAIGELQEPRRALGGRGARPGGERRDRGGNGGIDLRL